MTIPQTHLRLRIYASPQVTVRSLLEDLAESCRVVIRAIATSGESTTISIQSATPVNALDIELSGPPEAVQCWLSRLRHYPIIVRGKGNPDGDGWHY